jgi:hypothetical protein
MKTVMQVAIEHFKNINYDLVNVPIKNVPHILEQFLEKEKEQIKDAYENGSDVNDDLKPLYGTPEQYYNKTYNQNK